MPSQSKDADQTVSLRTWLQQRPFSLALSSGFFGFFAHAGVIHALESEGLYPQRLMGSSAGALVSGLWASGLSAAAIKSQLFELKKDDFWDPHFGLGLLKGDLFEACLHRFLACTRFEDCRIPVQMTAFDCFSLRARLFTQGDLVSAIRASCTFPGLFHPKWIDGRPYIDGGVSDRSGLYGAEENERILYHHLKSRSWWRTRLGLTSIPQRDQMFVLCLDDLPRCSPKQLELAPLAFERAREQTLVALDLPVLKSSNKGTLCG